jgi:hypothetical protein
MTDGPLKLICRYYEADGRGMIPIWSDSEKWLAMTVSYDRQDIEADRS